MSCPRDRGDTDSAKGGLLDVQDNQQASLRSPSQPIRLQVTSAAGVVEHE
jgi:hypothetical protein